MPPTGSMRVLHSPRMSIPPVDLVYLRDQFRELAARVREARDAAGFTPGEIDTPALLRDAMAQLVDMLGDHRDSDADSGLSAGELNTLTEYGLHLLDELAQLARDVGQASLAAEVECLSLPLALWVARSGGEIRRLAPVVNALAQFANESKSPQDMAALYACCCELVEAVSPLAYDETLAEEALKPWRLLLLNRAIAATRSHNPELMQQAFDAIVEQLPNEARRFFAEGMEQMAVVDYPKHVQELMRRYFLAYAAPRHLH